MAAKFDQKEGKRVLIALIFGFVVGLAIHLMNEQHLGPAFQPIGSILAEGVTILQPIGVLFIRLLKMIIVPLVFASIFMAIVNLGSPGALGNMGRKAITYYFSTTALAVFGGLVVVNILTPGVGADMGSAGLQGLSETMNTKITQNEGLWATIVSVIIDAVPTNPVQALANSSVLQIICFSILFSLMALYRPDDAKPIVNVVGALEKMTLTLTHVIMKLAPIGIFVLMLEVMAKSGLSAIQSLSWYMLTVVIGLGIHGVVLLLIGSYRLKKSPLFILKGISQAILTAFSTASSAATLPITMANVEDNLGVKKDTAKFVLPLGATVNMDGTALYESVAAIFIAQAYNIHLTIGQQVIIFMTASLAAVGAAAIPGAGLITMSIVLSAVGLPLEGIGLILAVDRILDMFRTAINVLGDSIGTIFVDTGLHPQDQEPALKEAPV